MTEQSHGSKNAGKYIHTYIHTYITCVHEHEKLFIPAQIHAVHTTDLHSLKYTHAYIHTYINIYIHTIQKPLPINICMCIYEQAVGVRGGVGQGSGRSTRASQSISTTGGWVLTQYVRMCAIYLYVCTYMCNMYVRICAIYLYVRMCAICMYVPMCALCIRVQYVCMYLCVHYVYVCNMYVSMYGHVCNMYVCMYAK